MKIKNSAPKIKPLGEILEEIKWQDLGWADGYYYRNLYRHVAQFPPGKYMKIYVKAFIDSILTHKQIGW